MMRRIDRRVVTPVRITPINRGTFAIPYLEIIRLAREAEQKRNAEREAEQKRNNAREEKRRARSREEKRREEKLSEAELEEIRIDKEMKDAAIRAKRAQARRAEIPIFKIPKKIGPAPAYEFTDEYADAMMDDIDKEENSPLWNEHTANAVADYIRTRINDDNRERLTPRPGVKYSINMILEMRSDISSPDGEDTHSTKMWTIPSAPTIYVIDGKYDLYTILYTTISAFLDRSDEYANKYYTYSGFWYPNRIMSVNLTAIDRLTDYDEKKWTTPIHRQRMGATRLGYKILSQNSIVNPERVRNMTGLCVIDALWNAVVKHNASPNSRMRKYTRDQIIRDMAALVRDDPDLQKYGMMKNTSAFWLEQYQTNSLESDATLIKIYGISLKNIVEWAKVNHFAIHALDYNGTIIERYVNANDHHHGTISFVINNNHLYEIPNEELANKITKTNHIDLCETKCSIRYATGDYAVLDEKSKYNLENVDKNVVVITDKQDLSELLAAAIKETGDVSGFIRVNKDNMITAFRHPGNGKIIVASPQYNLNKALCDYFHKEFKHASLAWANQSTTKISVMVFGSMGFVLPESHYPPAYQRLIDESKNMKPYITGNMPVTPFVAEPDFEPMVIGIDIKRAYKTFMINMVQDYCRFFGTEDTEVFDANKHMRNGYLVTGWYYINRAVIMCDGTMHFAADKYPPNWVQFLLTRGEISLDNITHVLRPVQSVDAKHFAEFAKKLYELEQKGLIPSSKEMINSLWGFMGTKQSTSTRATVTDSYAAVIDILAHELHVHKRCPSVYTVGDMHFVHSSSVTKLKTGYLPFHHQILAEGWIQLAVLHDRFSKYGQVLGYHTDCMKVLVTRKQLSVELKQEIASTAKNNYVYRIDKEDTYANYCKRIKTPLETPPLDVDTEVIVPFPYTTPDWVEYPVSKLETDEKGVVREIVPDLPTKSVFITGPPGSGKSTLFATFISMAIKQNKTFICLSFQHIVKTVMEDKLIKAGVDISKLGMGAPDILSSALNVSRRGYERVRDDFCKAEYVFIDEITAAPKAFLKLIDKMIKPEQKFIPFGDVNQCQSIETDDEDPTTYYYDQLPLFKRLCGGNIYHKEYIPGCMRFDETMRQQVIDFLKTRTIRARKPIPVSIKKRVMQTITALNENRHKNNKESLEKALASTHSRNVITIPKRASFMNDQRNKSYPNATTTQFIRSMPLICYKNPDLDYENKDVPIVHNADRFIVLGQGAKGLLLENIITHKVIDLPMNEVLNRMDYGYSMTSHKVQGTEITGEYIIENPSQMSFEMFYVAFTRATKAENVHYELEHDYTFPARRPNTYKTVNFEPKQLQCDIIYKLYSPESKDQMYISMCKRSLETELEEYKTKKLRTGKVVSAFIEQYKSSLQIEAIATYCGVNEAQMKRYQVLTIQDYAKSHRLLNSAHTKVIEAKEQKTKVTITEAPVFRPTITKSVPYHDEKNNRFRVTNKGKREDFRYGANASAERIAEYKAKACAYAEKLYHDQGGI